MKFQVLTIFPELFENFVKTSIIGRAVEKNAIEIEVVDIRDFTDNKHKKVDDIPFGGGAGMVMMPQPLFDAIEFLNKNERAPVIFMSPSNNVFDQGMAEEFARGKFPQVLHNQEDYLNKKIDRIILLCGRYEGIDNRVIENLVDAKLSIGNFILTGGELPAQIFIEAVARLLPEVLGNEESFEQESFSEKLGRDKIEHPHYTRPADFRGMKVPEVLLSGHHANIEKWKKENCEEM